MTSRTEAIKRKLEEAKQEGSELIQEYLRQMEEFTQLGKEVGELAGTAVPEGIAQIVSAINLEIENRRGSIEALRVRSIY